MALHKRVRHAQASSDQARNDLLTQSNELLITSNEDLASIFIAAETSLAALRRLEGPAIEMRKKSGEVFVLQRRPRSSIIEQQVSI